MALAENLENEEKTAFKKLLDKPLSRNYILMLADVAVEKNNLIKLSLEIIGEGSSRESKMASWLLSHIADSHPEILESFQDQLIELTLHTSADSIRRNLLRIIVLFPLPAHRLVPLFEQGLEWMLCQSYAIAVRANAMQLLYKICLMEPELASELQQHIAGLMEYDSAGLVSRGKKIMRQLQKIKTT